MFVDIIGHRPVIHTWFSLHSVRGYHWAPSSYTHLILIAQCSWISLGTVQLYTPDSHCTVFMDIIGYCPVIHTWFSLHSVRGYHWALSSYTHLILIAQCSWISLGTVQLYTPDSHCTVFVDIIRHRPVIYVGLASESVAKVIVTWEFRLPTLWGGDAMGREFRPDSPRAIRTVGWISESLEWVNQILVKKWLEVV